MTEIPRLQGWWTLADIQRESGMSKQSLNRMIIHGRIESVRRLGSEGKPIYVIRDWEVQDLIDAHRERMERREELARQHSETG